MRYPFVVILRRDNDRLINWISILLCSFTAGAFLLARIQKGQFDNFLKGAAILLFLALLFTILWMRSDRLGLAAGRRSPIRYRYWLLVSALVWLAMPYGQGFFFVFLLLTFLEYQAKYPLEIGFSPDKIVINSLLRKSYPWSAFSNVLLKDGLLTLDFKNNRLLQKEVDEEQDGDADEEEFNDYCREMLDAARVNGTPDAPRSDGTPDAARANGRPDTGRANGQ
ncbi:MAG TPA: hypothetical protein VGM31_08895 [Puia sp.]|jgi:hypothetical protein